MYTVQYVLHFNESTYRLWNLSLYGFEEKKLNNEKYTKAHESHSPSLSYFPKKFDRLSYLLREIVFFFSQKRFHYTRNVDGPSCQVFPLYRRKCFVFSQKVRAAL